MGGADRTTGPGRRQGERAAGSLELVPTPSGQPCKGCRAATGGEVASPTHGSGREATLPIGATAAVAVSCVWTERVGVPPPAT
jgi:hypothetical protein